MRAFIAVAASLALCLATGALAQTYTVLHEFGTPEDVTGLSFTPGDDDGQSPVGGVVSDGAKLYGVTEQGGADDGGIVYSMNLDGSEYAILHSFDENDYPTPGLTLANGLLYGTTEKGGADNMGMIYSISTAGSPVKAGESTSFTVLYSFPTSSLSNLRPSPVIVSGDTLYGQLIQDPVDPDPDQWGIVYSIKTDGTNYAVLTSFAGSPEDGEEPWGKLLLEGGILYGATEYGGEYYADAGTLFSLPVGGGAHTNLHDFSGTDGYGPMGELISDGSRLYGSTTYFGGIFASTVRRDISFVYGTTGTVFAVDKNGANFQTLHSFDTGTAAASTGKGKSLYDYHATGLARDGNTLYGTTFSITASRYAGASSDIDMGTIFSINTDGTGFTTLYSFDGLIGGTGSGPAGTLLLQNGTLYGTTLGGGANNDGVVYAYTVPPAPTPTPVPPIDLTANKTEFFTTDFIAVRANISVITTPCIPIVRILTPGGQALYCVQGVGLTDIPTPFLGSMTPVTVSAPITNYPIINGRFSAAAGTYDLQGAAIDATRTTDLLNPVYVGEVDCQELIVQ